jgi:hypothetical protein
VAAPVVATGTPEEVAVVPSSQTPANSRATSARGASRRVEGSLPPVERGRLPLALWLLRPAKPVHPRRRSA